MCHRVSENIVNVNSDYCCTTRFSRPITNHVHIKEFDFGRSFGVKNDFFKKKIKDFKVSVNPVELEALNNKLANREEKYRKGASACFNPDTLSLFISNL